MPLPPSRRDPTGPPPRNISDLSKIVRHHDSYLRQLDPGLQGGRFATPRPVPVGPSQIVGSDGGSGEGEDTAWEWDDRLTAVATGTQTKWLSYEPLEESLHVFWHPGGDGPLRLTNEFFTLSGQTVTIPDPGYFAPGDTFSFQYAYIIGQDAPEPSAVGYTTPGTWDSTAKTLSFAIPAGVVAGDFLVLAVRGSVAAGGGELTDGLSCPDPRMTLIYTATSMNGAQPVVEKIWAGFATGSGSPVLVNVATSTYPTAQARGILAAFRGVNGYSSVTAVETGTTTPVVDGIAAVAVTWLRTSGFATVNAAPPTGYTDTSTSGADYYSTDISWWYNPDASSSPSGTFSGEGCCVIALT